MSMKRLLASGKGKGPLVIDITRAGLAKINPLAATEPAVHEAVLAAAIAFGNRQKGDGYDVLFFQDEAQTDMGENVFIGNFVKNLDPKKLAKGVSYLGTTNNPNIFKRQNKNKVGDTDPKEQLKALGGRLKLLVLDSLQFDILSAEEWVRSKVPKDFDNGDEEGRKEVFRIIKNTQNVENLRLAEQELMDAVQSVEMNADAQGGEKTFGMLKLYLKDRRTAADRASELLADRRR